MKNLKSISRKEMKVVMGGIESNCHCSPGDSGKPAIDTIADNAEACFAACERYRNS